MFALALIALTRKKEKKCKAHGQYVFLCGFTVFKSVYIKTVKKSQIYIFSLLIQYVVL
jgi:hypothetical protein